MTVATSLRGAQRTRFAALDELLPDMTPNPAGELLPAALADGRRVAGTLLRIDNPAGTLPSLWSMRQVWELFPLVGEHADAGVDALLRAWRGLLDRTRLGADSACVVTWPSRDVTVSRVLLGHGFVPMTVLAVRQSGRAGTPVPRLAPGVTVRRARADDLTVATEIAMAELAYSANLGGTIPRQDATELKRSALSYHLEQQDPVWIIERDGIAVGIAECWVTDASVGASVRFPVPVGRWGYVEHGVGAARRAGWRARPAADGRRAPRSGPAPGSRQLPVLQPGESALVGVLAAPGLPSAVDHLGDPAGGRPALNAELFQTRLA